MTMTAVRQSVAYCYLTFHITLLTAALIISRSQCSSVEIDRFFLSGAADTTQHFNLSRVTDDGSRINYLESTSKIHHLVCFHRGGTYNPYASNIAQGREKCCNELYQNGLIERDGRKYCLDHVAMVPTISAGGKKSGGLLGNVAPAFYLAQVEEVTGSKKTSLNRSYNQNRQLKVYEDKERESFRDGFKGVGAFSPFHLTGFMFNGLIGSKSNGEVFPLRGKVWGELSRDGGMHRSFHQKMHLSLDNLSATAEKNYRMNINATIFLPIAESIFIDADDPLLVEYESGTPDGVSCKVSIDNEIMIQRSLSICNIQFLHPETIDIEQPSFASRQYIVAYQVSAMLDLSFEPNTEGIWKELEVVIDYGTTLHIRYPPPISNKTDEAMNGLVPIVIKQPSLYSASVSLGDEIESNAKYYTLQTDVTEETSNPPDPIIIHAAAGLDSDYWWITGITMSSALIGGLVLIKSLDSVSIWC